MEAAELATLIRERSREGELLALADLEAELADCRASMSDAATEPLSISALIQKVLTSHADIKTMLDGAGAVWYFSEQFMTSAYARVLLLRKEGPLRMMAEVIREHSRLYPRPVPLALFQSAPFNLSDQAVALCLREMAGASSYRDIACLTTSLGNVFAYSTDHLEGEYATMLAEWADVGQAENP